MPSVTLDITSFGARQLQPRWGDDGRGAGVQAVRYARVLSDDGSGLTPPTINGLIGTGTVGVSGLPDYGSAYPSGPTPLVLRGITTEAINGPAALVRLDYAEVSPNYGSAQGLFAPPQIGLHFRALEAESGGTVAHADIDGNAITEPTGVPVKTIQPVFIVERHVASWVSLETRLFDIGSGDNNFRCTLNSGTMTLPALRNGLGGTIACAPGTLLLEGVEEDGSNTGVIIYRYRLRFSADHKVYYPERGENNQHIATINADMYEQVDHGPIGYGV